MYLSEISTFNGEYLTEEINDGNKEFTQYKNLLVQPIQPKPNARSWVLWDIHLSIIYVYE